MWLSCISEPEKVDAERRAKEEAAEAERKALVKRETAKEKARLKAEEIDAVVNGAKEEVF